MFNECPILHCIGNLLTSFQEMNNKNMSGNITETGIQCHEEEGEEDDEPHRTRNVSQSSASSNSCGEIGPGASASGRVPNVGFRRKRNFYQSQTVDQSALLYNVPNNRSQPEKHSKQSILVSCPFPLSNSLLRIQSWMKVKLLKRMKLIISLFPVLLSILIYSNTFFGDFVHDDIPAIVRNPDVNGQNSFMAIFSNDFWGTPMNSEQSHKSYRPLTILLFRFNFKMCDGKSSCFHGTNILLHGCATYLLTQVCRTILNLDTLTTSVTAILFALHPIHTEAVSGLVGCADLLACNFTLLSFLTYTRYLKNPRELKWHLGSLIAASFAVLSKETGITALAINISYGAAHISFTKIMKSAKKISQSKKIAIKRISTDALMLGLLLVCRLLIQKSSLPYFSAQDNPAAFHTNEITRTLTFLYLPVLNFWLLLCPCWLTYDWQMGSVPLLSSVYDLRWILVLVFYGSLLLLTLQAMKRLQKRIDKTSSENTSKRWQDGSQLRTLIAAILFLVLPFLPASNLFFPVGFVLAERILYLPSVGFCFLVGLGWQIIFKQLSLSRKRLIAKNTKRQQVTFRRLSKCRLRRTISTSAKRNSSDNVCDSSRGHPQQPMGSCNFFTIIAFTFLLMIFIVFATKTWTRNKDWMTRASLFRSGLKSLPSNGKIHYNYANVLKEEGKFKLASEHYTAALRLWPNYTMAYNNLATVLTDKIEAEVLLRKALNIDPWHANSLYNLAALLSERNMCSEAVVLLENCIAEDPSHERALLLLSDCLLKMNDQEIQNFKNENRIKKEEDYKDPDSKSILVQRMTSSNKSSAGHEQPPPSKLNSSENVESGSSLLLGHDADDDTFKKYRRIDERDWSQILSKIGSNAPPSNAQPVRLTSFLSHLAEAYIGVGHWRKAESLLERILSIQPEHQVALYQISQVYLELNQTSSALSAIRAAKSLCQNLKPNHRNEEKADLSLQGSAAPCLWAKRCIPRGKICTGILIQEADILREMRFFRLAAKNYKKALEIFPFEPALLLSLGSVHHAMGEWDKAWINYQKCLQIQPDNQILIANINLLIRSSNKQLFSFKHVLQTI